MSPVISGTVTDDSGEVEGAKVAVIDTKPEEPEDPGPSDWELVGGDITDSNGEYSITVEAGTDRYHVLVQWIDEFGNYWRADSYPYVSVS